MTVEPERTVRNSVVMEKSQCSGRGELGRAVEGENSSRTNETLNRGQVERTAETPSLRSLSPPAGLKVRKRDNEQVEPAAMEPLRCSLRPPVLVDLVTNGSLKVSKVVAEDVSVSEKVAEVPFVLVEGKTGKSSGNSTTGKSSYKDVAHIAVVENRFFVTININGTNYSAMVDLGAQVTVVSPGTANRFKSRLKTPTTVVKGVSGEEPGALGDLKLHLEIGGNCGALTACAVARCAHDLILSVDFWNEWMEEFSIERREWRPKGSKSWIPFASNEKGSAHIFAECAGLTKYRETQREQVLHSIALKPGTAPAVTDLIKHIIDVSNARPIKTSMRRMSLPILSFAQEETMQIWRAEIIRPSDYQWSSAPVIVKKAVGTYRFCLDLCPVNKVTKIDACPIPNLDSILDRLRSAVFLSKIDLRSAFWQIPLKESSKQYTVFAVLGSGLWEFERIPFGRVNASATFMQLMDALFGPEYSPNVFWYMDDSLVVSTSFEDHMAWLGRVLRRLVEVGLEINLGKSDFFCTEVTHLGYRLDCEGLRPDPERIQPILDYSVPRNIEQLRRFLGMVGWYARFIENESDAKVPLMKLIKKNQLWMWGEQQETFER
ncbi:uncharacterized protein LOC131673535 [Phymastichus coffea]|uniref:uncharacterized protein LOC131673535 n=1 Tax=Phymastichus coffea TaxID=108790 RepID=UPI00273A76DC|nr:uncharacterized protein LOC131673535 [Phymastichus coffea]